MSSVIVLRTHRVDDPAIVDLFYKLREDCGVHRVYVMFDDTKGAWNESDDSKSPEHMSKDTNVFLVTDGDCTRANSMHDRGFRCHSEVSWMFWHPETSFVLCHDWLRSKEAEGTCPPFDYVWFLEYDVRCTGRFSEAFAVCDEIDADFMACGKNDVKADHLRLAKEEPGWCWFPRLDGEIVARVPLVERVGAFFPMVRFSTSMAEAVRNEFGKSTGFCEVYVPTLAAFAPGIVSAAIPPSVLGKFQYSPIISREEWDDISKSHGGNQPAQFYHPIK
jgi:hypothetical protein